MTAPSDVQSLAGAVLYGSATIPATFDQAGYESTDLVWTRIGDIENYGNHGGTKTITEFTPVDTATVAKVGGSKNYGTMALMIGKVYSDAGQQMLNTAFESSNTHYSFKLVYNDAGAATPEVHYIDALVSKFENQDGAVNDVRKVAVDLAISKKPVVIAPT